MKNKILILGIRGLPAAHGGFEAFAEKLALYLVAQGWHVTVYCQEERAGEVIVKDWRGIELVGIPIRQGGSLGTIIFDWKSILYSLKSDGLILTLGYNTAIFNVLYRIKRRKNIINMDGIEWKRAKWPMPVRVWFYLNERLGCYLGNHLIADHPEIKNHLKSRVAETKITTIAYGADDIADADVGILTQYGVVKDGYFLIIARAEPENSILEIVKAFSREANGKKLVVLGRFDEDNEYHQAVLSAASSDVLFVGAIYERETVSALRFYCLAYVHGHQVGGTNPSLVEALGAGSAVIAHDNKYNRWVAGSGASYFSGTDALHTLIGALAVDSSRVSQMKLASKAQFKKNFLWSDVLRDYEKLLSCNL